MGKNSASVISQSDHRSVSFLINSSVGIFLLLVGEMLYVPPDTLFMPPTAALEPGLGPMTQFPGDLSC